MKKNKKDREYRNLDALFERLTQKAVIWNAEKDYLNKNDPLDQEEFWDEQVTNGEDRDN